MSEIAAAWSRRELETLLKEDGVENCPIRDVLGQVSGKWSSLLLMALGGGPMRFAELKRSAPDISQRMLTKTLKDLQRDGYIVRTVYPTQPPRVEYALTETGRSFLTPLQVLVEWAKYHHRDIRQARIMFDQVQEEVG